MIGYIGICMCLLAGNIFVIKSVFKERDYLGLFNMIIIIIALVGINLLYIGLAASQYKLDQKWAHIQDKI